MVKKNYILKLFVLCASLLSSAYLFAETNVSVVDLPRAISASNFAQQKFKELKANKSYQDLVGEIERLQGELKGMQKDGKTKSLTWSDAQKKEHRQKMQNIFDQLNHLANQEAGARQNLQSSVEKAMSPELEKIVNDIIDEEGIQLLLKSGAIYFSKPELDITQEVIKRLNSQ